MRRRAHRVASNALVLAYEYAGGGFAPRADRVRRCGASARKLARTGTVSNAKRARPRGWRGRVGGWERRAVRRGARGACGWYGGIRARSLRVRACRSRACTSDASAPRVRGVREASGARTRRRTRTCGGRGLARESASRRVALARRARACTRGPGGPAPRVRGSALGGLGRALRVKKRARERGPQLHTTRHSPGPA